MVRILTADGKEVKAEDVKLSEEIMQINLRQTKN